MNAEDREALFMILERNGLREIDQFIARLGEIRRQDLSRDALEDAEREFIHGNGRIVTEATRARMETELGPMRDRINEALRRGGFL